MRRLLFVFLLVAGNAFAAVTDLKIGTNQIFNANFTRPNTISLFGEPVVQRYSITYLRGPTFTDGVTATSYGTTQMEPIKAAGQYFKLHYADKPTVNWFALRLHNADGSVARIVSTGGPILGMADGLIHYKSNDQYDVFITPNQGFNQNTSYVNSTGAATLNFSNRFDPTPAQLAAYTPPGSNTPIYTAGQTVPLSGGIAGGNPTPQFSSGITAVQSAEYSAKKTSQSSITSGNKVYLEEKPGTSGSIVNIEQSGFSNTVRGLDGGNATIEGMNNQIHIKQGSRTGSTAGKNLIEFSVKGSYNNLTIAQSRNINGNTELSGDSNNHYTSTKVNGNGNTVDIRQSSTTAGHYASTVIDGHSNTIKLQQITGGEKRFWGTTTGNSNTMEVLQLGAGGKYLDISLTGIGNRATVKQDGDGVHRATISLTNAGGASTIILNQLGGNTLNAQNQMSPQVYNISQTCVSANGCSVSITQGQ